MSKQTHETKYLPTHIANFFLWKADEENIKNLTPLKLIKLVYFAYGWYLAVYDKKLFCEKIEAWRYGPVIPSLYHEFKEFGNSAVCQFAVEFAPETGEFEYPVVAQDDKDVLQILGAVWEIYKNRSGIELSEITHSKDSPWHYSFVQGENKIIEDEVIKNRAKEAILKYKDYQK